MDAPSLNILSTTEARNAFSDVLNTAAYAKERVVLTRRGRPLVAVVSIEDLRRLEALDQEQAEPQADGRDAADAFSNDGPARQVRVNADSLSTS